MHDKDKAIIIQQLFVRAVPYRELKFADELRASTMFGYFVRKSRSINSSS